jgi:GNAT superfamily N-acetyltransferase
MTLTSEREVILREVPFESVSVDRLLEEWNAELVATVAGFSPDGGSLVREGDFVRPRGGFLVGTVGGVAAGCGGVRTLSGRTGEVKRLFVRRAARGAGVGQRLLSGLEDLARELNFEELRLDTMGQPAALALFRTAGWEEVPDYNDNSRARHWFAKRL